MAEIRPQGPNPGGHTRCRTGNPRPGDLEIESLVQRVAVGGVKEVVFALSTTMEGDTTNFYIYRKLEKLGVKLSVIARGISVGDELEYADEVTLGRSIVNRTPFTGAV